MAYVMLMPGNDLQQVLTMLPAHVHGFYDNTVQHDLR